MKKIVYYTTLKGIKRRLKDSTPKGFEVEVIETDKLSNLVETNSVAFRFWAITKWKKADIIHYVTDRPKGQSLRGRHHRFFGKSYCRSWVRKDWWVELRKGDNTANDRKYSGDMKQLEYTVYHENLHALSDILDKKDRLHEWVGLGKFMDYERDYLGNELDDLLPLVKKRFHIGERIMAEVYNDPVVLVEGYRSCEKQNQYYKEGKTNAKCGESTHQYGVGIDYRFKKAPYYPPSGHPRWNRANTIFKAMGFYSYGLNEGWDDGHIQLMLDYKSERDLRKNIDYSRYW